MAKASFTAATSRKVQITSTMGSGVKVSEKVKATVTTTMRTSMLASGRLTKGMESERFSRGSMTGTRVNGKMI